MQRTRRTVLAGAAALAAGGLAGCSFEPGLRASGESNEGAYTSFFTLEDFTRQVVGDAMPVENPVPAGQMGHRYEVGNEAQLDAARSAAFVYVDIPGFQNWARATAANLRDRHHEVTVVDALEGVELRDFDEAAGDDGEHGDGDHADGEHGDGHDGHAEEETDRADDDHGDDGGHGDGEGGHDGHDHDGVDPHYWLDPIRAAESVEVIAAGLAEADPDNAERYESNAADYVAELDALDETFATALADRDLDTVVVAGHDSYQYLASRYDFEIHSPVGVSPNVEPSSAEIAATIDVVDEHGVEVVLYDAFGSPTLAETIVRESDAREAVPVSPVEGTRPAWDDRGWGYVEQMTEVNLPAFQEALNAT